MQVLCLWCSLLQRRQRYPSHPPLIGAHPSAFGVGKTMENPMYINPTIQDEDNEGLLQPDFDDQPDIDEKEN